MEIQSVPDQQSTRPPLFPAPQLLAWTQHRHWVQTGRAPETLWFWPQEGGLPMLREGRKFQVFFFFSLCPLTPQPPVLRKVCFLSSWRSWDSQVCAEKPLCLFSSLSSHSIAAGSMRCSVATKVPAFQPEDWKGESMTSGSTRGTMER